MMRSRSRRQRREHLAVSRGEIPSDGSSVIVEGDDLVAIDKAIDREGILLALDDLPDRYHDVVSLRYLSGLTAAETAEAMGLSRGNVAVMLHRALGALRNNIEAAQ